MEMIKMIVAAGVRARRSSFAKNTGAVEGGGIVHRYWRVNGRKDGVLEMSGQHWRHFELREDYG